MGLGMSKEDDLTGVDSPLTKDALVHIFEYTSSMDELVPMALVNRWWAALLGQHVVPSHVKRLALHAWYNGDSIKSMRAPSGVDACSVWHASPKGCAALLDCFPFPGTLRSRVGADSADAKSPEAMARLGQWAAAAAKGGEPRVLKTKQGRKCLSFVDAPGRHPVHLRTALFPGGALPQPLTIMVVGIAFEDATYVSGINDRFEVRARGGRACGRVPLSRGAARIVCTFCFRERPVGKGRGYDLPPPPPDWRGCFPCLFLPFSQVCHAYPAPGQPDTERAPVSMTAHPVGDSDDSDDDPSPSCIVCGATQPGEWHVYTAGTQTWWWRRRGTRARFDDADDVMMMMMMMMMMGQKNSARC
jgi:hypothetical protein